MNRRLVWDDLWLVLAVVEAGTLSGAGRRLELSHSTVYRRLGEIEKRLGVKLFDRSRAGYAATLAGEEVATAARRIQTEVLDVERRVVGRDLRPSGTVRVTTTDTLLVGLLSPIFSEFRKAYQDISLEIAVSNEIFSLSKREADVAVRPSIAPPETLLGRKIGTIAQAIYGRKDRIPENGSDLNKRSMSWVGPDERMGYRMLERWMADEELGDNCQYRVDTLFGMFAAVRDGAGLAVLPCYLADGDQRLMRFGEAIPALSTDLWLLTHPDLRRTARIQALLRFLANAVKDRSAWLSGRAGQP